MSTELHWPRESTFHDPRGEDGEETYYTGPGTFDVPDGKVDQYLNRGWQHPEEAGVEEAPPAPEDPEPDADTESAGSEEADSSEEDGSEEFDAAGFVDDSWQSVTSQIEDGAADEHLDAVEAAERDRDGEPRSSVIEAIEDRR
jgi:hypothetical protein